MRTIACDATVIDLQLPACADEDGTYSATLMRSLTAAHALEVTLLDAAPAPPILRLALPDPVTTPLQRGVWTLSVKTPCGCYNTTVFVEGTCAPLALSGVHTPLREPIAPTPVDCAPAIQPDLEAANPTLGFEFSRDTEGLLTGIDLQADPPYGEQTPLPAPPAFTALSLRAEIHGLTLQGTLGPVPDALNGRPWTLFDRNGRAIADGTLVVVGSVATLSATLTAYLLCGPHYLTITGAALP